jgi:hypothetical protein
VDRSVVSAGAPGGEGRPSDPRTLDEAAPAREAAQASQRDFIAWSWAFVDRELLDPSTDPSGVLPFLDVETDEIYWELHFQRARLTRTDFLHRAKLVGGNDAPASADPVVGALRAWFADADTRARCHPTAWLELDGPLGSPPLERRQGVSVCLDRHIGTPAANDPLALAHPVANVLAIWSRLQRACGEPPRSSPALRRAWTAAVAHGGGTRHLSIMRGRPGSPGKMYVALPKSTFKRWLFDIEWPGDVEGSVSLGNDVCAASVRVNVDLELAPNLTPRIGFEIFGDPEPGRDPQRSGALEIARSLGLISTRQVAALQRWSGVVRKRLGGDVWPTTLQRWLDLKFVLNANEDVELKAYLGFRRHQGIF